MAKVRRSSITATQTGTSRGAKRAKVAGDDPADQLHKQFDEYQTPGTAPREELWISFESFFKYAASVGVANPESFEALRFMYFFKCPCIGVLTRDSFIETWTAHGAFALDSQRKVWAEARQAELDRDEARQLYLHAFTLFAGPPLPGSITQKDRFVGQKLTKIPAAVALEAWTALRESPTFNWQSPSEDWIGQWLSFISNRLPQNIVERELESDGEDGAVERVDFISKHVWGALPSFAERCREEDGLSWWNEDQEWPTMIDSFASLLLAERKKEGGQGKRGRKSASGK